MTIEQRLDMERDDRRHESPQARLSGRRKFTFCHWCGRPDGMKAAHRETLAELSPARVVLTAPWYRELGNDEYLFYVCPECNRDRTIPDGFIIICDVGAWLNADPMAPDYAALADAEPVLASDDSRDSAGI